MKLKNYACGKWIEGEGGGISLYNAVTGEQVAVASSEGLDFKAMLEYGRNTGGPALRKMTFHERARMLKELALYLNEKKNIFYQLSYATGATKGDSWIDIEGGIGNLFVYASKGRREFPDETFYVDGKAEKVSKQGTFIGHHICVPLEGVAVHINAFNFPCWGMLEKIAVNFLAGVPAIVKPATVTSFLTELMVREIIASKILPEGALQLICGSTGDLLDYIMEQDVITFTGSAETGKKLKTHKNIIDNSVRFNMEADSLNFCVLGPDATSGSEVFNLFIKEVAKEITVKAGQKCTAIRRTIVAENMSEPVINALKKRLIEIKLGNPLMEGVRMGPLAGKTQVSEVKANVTKLMKACEVVYGDYDDFEVIGADKHKGAFLPSMLLYCDLPFKKTEPHTIEAFGPVSTLMPYKNTDEAIQLTKMGRGSLCGSVFTADDNFAREIVLGTGAYHGRIVVINPDCAAESTGHGSPLPHLIHGGPGRAGGGEEMGGVRGVMHYMQRVAVQGSPTTLTKITNQYQYGGKYNPSLTLPEGKGTHPFRKYFEELQIGETLITEKYTITEDDVINFANLSGDKFYAHLEPKSLEGTIFKRTVAHGYFILSRAAGLFVDPPKGPVLLNYGIDECRFTKPVYPGMTIGVRFTCKEKIGNDKPLKVASPSPALPEGKGEKSGFGKPASPSGRDLGWAGEIKCGIVKWVVDVYDASPQEVRDKYGLEGSTGDTVAIATILTMVARKENS